MTPATGLQEHFSLAFKAQDGNARAVTPLQQHFRGPPAAQGPPVLTLVALCKAHSPKNLVI